MACGDPGFKGLCAETEKEEEEEKYKILKVTVEEDYLIPMYDDKQSKINGWTIEEIIKDWFTTHASTSYHATRDSHRIGNSRKFIKSEVAEEIK